MGRFIIPVAIIFYIVSSVIGAVLKALTSSSPPVSREKPRVPEFEGSDQYKPQEIPVKSLAEYKQELERTSDFPQFEDEQEISSTSVAASSRTINAQRVARIMRKGFIMSEIYREPRSQRPWPDR